MAIRLVGDPRSTVQILGPEGRTVGHAFIDLNRYGIADPILDGDLGPYALNCLDGVVFIVHRESTRKASYLSLTPMQLSKHPELAKASRLPYADVCVRDYVKALTDINKEELLRLEKAKPQTKARKNSKRRLQ